MFRNLCTILKDLLTRFPLHAAPRNATLRDASILCWRGDYAILRPGKRVTCGWPGEAPINPILAILGPTATGKTEVGIRLAEALGGEIISADSLAVYRGLDIGTAKPDSIERARIPFHLIDVSDPDAPFTVARFKALAEEALRGIRARGRRPLLVGGTGLYVKALLEDYGLTSTPGNPAIRERLDSEAAERGSPALHERLAKVDSSAAAKIHPNDRVRIVRALEVYERTGVPISVQQARDAENRSPCACIKFALSAARETLYARIDRRVDAMLAHGLVDEVRGLLEGGYPDSLPPLRSLGYKEICAYLRGDTDLDTAVSEIKLNTRRFAKRQWTWFRADHEIIWIDVEHRSTEQVAAVVLSHMEALR